jgi:hypothetical protein
VSHRLFQNFHPVFFVLKFLISRFFLIFFRSFQNSRPELVNHVPGALSSSTAAVTLDPTTPDQTFFSTDLYRSPSLPLWPLSLLPYPLRQSAPKCPLSNRSWSASWTAALSSTLTSLEGNQHFFQNRPPDGEGQSRFCGAWSPGLRLPDVKKNYTFSDVYFCCNAAQLGFLGEREIHFFRGKGKYIVISRVIPKIPGKYFTQ